MPDFDQNEATQMLETALNPQASSSGAPESASTTQNEEMIEYYLGDKANKLPMSVQIALKEKGKLDKIPFSNIINGYRMNQKNAKLYEEANKLKPQYEMTNAELEKYKKELEVYKPFKELQDWSVSLEKSNPAGYKYLMDVVDRLKTGTFNPSGETQGETNPLHHTISEQANQIKELLEWKSQWTQEQEAKKMEEDRKFVDSEILDAKKKFPEINLDEVDENQITLSTRIEHFGVQKGYQNFTDAFYAYFRDKLPDILAQRGRTEALSKLKKDNVEGIVARSSKPFLSGHPIKADNDSNKILAEFESIMNRS